MLHKGLTQEQSDFWNALGDHSYIVQMCKDIDDPFEIAHTVGSELTKITDKESRVVDNCLNVMLDKGLTSAEATSILRQWIVKYKLSEYIIRGTGFARFRNAHGDYVIKASEINDLEKRKENFGLYNVL